MDISENEIHLWYVFDQEICDPELLAQYMGILTEQEQEQQRCFHFAKHRHQYLITRALVRTVFSEYDSNILPESWTFSKNDYGKPFVSNENISRPLQFNLSHTDQLITMAVTLNSSVGIDVEYLNRSGKTVEIADSFFSPSEVQQLLSFPEEQRSARFFDFWTLKEAYIKACGMGLSIPLNEFSYSFDQRGKISIAFLPARNDQAALWRFWQVKLSDCHTISMALKRDNADSQNAENQYVVSTRKIIPFSSIRKVDCPISCGYIFSE